MSIINAPFTEEQIEALKQHQENGMIHPYTCDRKSTDCEVRQTPRDFSKDGVLIPTTEGWVCPCKKYTQNWAHG